MNKPVLHNSFEALPVAPSARPIDVPIADHRPDAEMARVLRIAPLRMASGPSEDAVARRKHGALHDVVKPMVDHVVSYPSGVQRQERRDGNSVASGTARSGVVTIIPAGSFARRDSPGLIDVVQLYLTHTTLERVAREADHSGPDDLLDRTAPDTIISWLLLNAADVLEGNEALDALFRQQPSDLLATHAGAPTTSQPITGGLSPIKLRRALERLRSNGDADVSLSALASDADLSRFHFCRAFKESTGLSPHAWLRQHRLEKAMKMLRDTDESIMSAAVELGYASQSAFAAAFKRLTGETPSDWRRRARCQCN
ncbi:helix-turn-helix domain-containing protein [Bradyrhizobium iriomotense]|uniref:helix-turn-helix domain-containing protein n=1 Tax=Bradyrhizobium iriomotense TaxID=441950 RepID=UPI0024E128FF|nr:AraC family transcriptional regulator [Bradyrhizobium iriomotense]